MSTSRASTIARTGTIRSGAVRNGPGRSVVAIVAGYLATNIATVAATLVVLFSNAQRLGFKYTSYLWAVSIGQIIGGYVAAAIAREKETLHGVVLAVALDIALIMWFGTTFFMTPGSDALSTVMKILLSLAAPVFGAYLRARHNRKAALRRAEQEESFAGTGPTGDGVRSTTDISSEA